MSWKLEKIMRLDVCDLQNTKNTQKAEPMICDDCFHNTVCRLDGNEMLEWCSARVPSANIVEVKRGEWVECDETSPDYEYCSICKWSNDVGARHYRFCPHCGADMRGEQK